MNGGHFEHKFCTYDFLVCFVQLNNTGLRKGENKNVKCVTFVSETFTQDGSNKIKDQQEILAPSTLAFFAKLCMINYEYPSIFVKVTAKISGTFFI